MGQKINPVGFRLGIVRGWDSNWYGGNNYAEKLIEDEKIRKYLYARLAKGGANPFVDPDGYREFVKSKEQTFLQKLSDQKKGGK